MRGFLLLFLWLLYAVKLIEKKYIKEND